MNPRSFPNLLQWAAVLLPAAAAAVWYSQTLAFGFVWDDTHIFAGPRVTADPASLWQWITSPFLQEYFRPLPLLVLALEQALSGNAPALSHGISVSLHVANTVMAGCLASRMNARTTSSSASAAWAGLACASVYAFHPALIEGVSWISARFDLLMTTFALAALTVDQRLGSPRSRAWCGGLFFLLAALCKEMALGLALALPLWHLLNAGTEGPRGFRGLLADGAYRQVYLAYLCAGLLYLAMRGACLPTVLPSGAIPDLDGFFERAVMLGKALGRYHLLALWPFSWQGPIHYLAQSPKALDAEVLLGWMAVLGATGLLLFSRGALRRLAYCWMAFLLSLLPVSGILPLALADSFAAERFLQLPMFFLALAAGEVLGRHLRAAAAPAVLWLGLAAWQQQAAVPAWRNEAALWEYAYSQSPQSMTVTANIIALLTNAGQLERARAFAEQVREQQGGQFYPDQQIGYAYLLSLQGQHQDALNYLRGAAAAFDRADELRQFDVRKIWGLIALNQGDLETALLQLQQAALLQPANAEVNYYLGLALQQRGDHVEARRHLDRAYGLSAAGQANLWRDRAGHDAAALRSRVEEFAAPGAQHP